MAAVQSELQEALGGKLEAIYAGKSLMKTECFLQSVSFLQVEYVNKNITMCRVTGSC